MTLLIGSVVYVAGLYAFGGEVIIGGVLGDQHAVEHARDVARTGNAVEVQPATLQERVDDQPQLVDEPEPDERASGGV